MLKCDVAVDTLFVVLEVRSFDSVLPPRSQYSVDDLFSLKADAAYLQFGTGCSHILRFPLPSHHYFVLLSPLCAHIPTHSTSRYFSFVNHQHGRQVDEVSLIGEITVDKIVLVMC